MNLREYLEEYKALTLDIMEEIRENGNISGLIEEREYILKSINNLNFDKEEIKRIGNSLNLINLEEDLCKMYNQEKVRIKQKIQNVKDSRRINNNYNSIENISRVFNKSV